MFLHRSYYAQAGARNCTRYANLVQASSRPGIISSPGKDDRADGLGAPDPAGDRVIDQTGGGQKTGILIHSNTVPTKPLRPQDLMSRTKNDPLEPDAKLKRKEYERKLARPHGVVAPACVPVKHEISSGGWTWIPRISQRYLPWEEPQLAD
jgi:hypothetical protein